MSTALLLVLASALTHATWNAMIKRSRDPAAGAAVLSLGAALISGLLALTTGQLHLPGAALPATLASGVIEAVYFVTLARALQALPLGTAYGIARGGGLLLTWPLSILLLSEPLDLRSGLGAGALSAGLLALIRGGGKGLHWAFSCALAIGFYPLAYKQALLQGAPVYTLFCLSLLLSWPVQVAALGSGRPGRLVALVRREPVLALAGSVLCAGSFLLYLTALQWTGAGWASSLRNTSVLFATLAGWAMGEPRTRRSLLSAVAIAAGALLLAH